MDLEKLEKMAQLVLDELPETAAYVLRHYPEAKARFKNLMRVASKSLPEHSELFSIAYQQVDKEYGGLAVEQACSIIEHLLKIIAIEKSSETRIKEMKIFESAEEKLKQANLSFRKDDYPSTVHNLNTALELVLKDKIGIPTTITGINTSNIMDVLTKYKVEPFLYLEEARKHVLVIDNKIKHQGYSPSKVDCINGIKAMEELIGKLRNTEMKLTEEVKNKIYDGL
jgi:HEPN domain-containing protein